MNQRTDEYGQTIENKSRFLFMILEEVTKVFPSNCIGIRFSPWTSYFFLLFPLFIFFFYTNLILKLFCE